MRFVLLIQLFYQFFTMWREFTAREFLASSEWRKVILAGNWFAWSTSKAHSIDHIRASIRTRETGDSRLQTSTAGEREHITSKQCLFSTGKPILYYDRQWCRKQKIIEGAERSKADAKRPTNGRCPGPAYSAGKFSMI